MTLLLVVVALARLGAVEPEVRYEQQNRRIDIVKPVVLASVAGAAGFLGRRVVLSTARRLIWRDSEVAASRTHKVGSADHTATGNERMPSNGDRMETQSAARDAENDGEKFALTQERLSAIASLNPQARRWVVRARLV